MEGMKEVLMVVTLGMDPTRPSILYAGTSGGVYKTVNEGTDWEKVNNGLVPPEMVKTSRALNVTSIEVDRFEPDTVYAATLSGVFLVQNWRIAIGSDDHVDDSGSHEERSRVSCRSRWRAS
jgi:hypothetical protein